MPELSFYLTKQMTSFVTLNKYQAQNVVWPAYTFISKIELCKQIIGFLDTNPEGVRNCDVGKAIGYQDTRQWFSYGILEGLIKENKVEKKNINGKTLYFSVN